MVRINRTRTNRRRKSRRYRHRKQQKQRGLTQTLRGSGYNNIRAQTLRGGRVNVNNCPPLGYHIYLRSMHPAARIEVTCAELQERINANQHENIFIETPGPHNDEDERETVIKYNANFFGPGAYVVGRVGRPEALELPPAFIQPGVVPPAPRLHRQYAMGEHVPYANLINHITESINAEIQRRARPGPDPRGVPPGPGLPGLAGLPPRPAGLPPRPGQGARGRAGDMQPGVPILHGFPGIQGNGGQPRPLLRGIAANPEVARRLGQFENVFPGAQQPLLHRGAILAGGPVIEGEGARARAGNQGPIVAGWRLQDINEQLAGHQLEPAERIALEDERRAIQRRMNARQVVVPNLGPNPERHNNIMENNN